MRGMRSRDSKALRLAKDGKQSQSSSATHTRDQKQSEPASNAQDELPVLSREKRNKALTLGRKDRLLNQLFFDSETTSPLQNGLEGGLRQTNPGMTVAMGTGILLTISVYRSASTPGVSIETTSA